METINKEDLSLIWPEMSLTQTLDEIIFFLNNAYSHSLESALSVGAVTFSASIFIYLLSEINELLTNHHQCKSFPARPRVPNY